MSYMIAVIDIGMTNKKVAVYDEHLRQITVAYKTFPPVMIDGLETHDLAGMEEWFLDRLSDAASKYPVKAVAVTTHGATFVCVGSDGKPCVPCVFYTHEPGDALHDRFYSLFGKSEDLQEETGTPAFKAMINPAKGILFAKERFPADFAKTKMLLNYPQYWGYRLSGATGAEGTYTGCHTYLWDWKGNGWSSVARGLGIVPMLPPALRNSWDVLGTITPEISKRTGLDPDTIVTMGIHDSNSSLLPHFAKKGETGFMLNSTGTWCVIMNPVEKYGFRKNELGKVVFFNLSAFRRPVKTAIFLGGQEYETWSKILMEMHGRADFPPWDEDLFAALFADNDLFVLPELVAGSGQFPGSKPCVIEGGKVYPFEAIRTRSSVPPAFHDYEKAFAALKASLVIQTLVAFDRAGVEAGKDIYTEGGFRKNEAYNALLSSALPDNTVLLTDIAEATALGAAMTAKMALTGKKLADLAGDFDVTYAEVKKIRLSGFATYQKKWLELTERNTARI